MLSAVAPDVFAMSMAAAIILGLWRSDALKARYCVRAPPPVVREASHPLSCLISARAAIPRMPGTASIKISCRLPSSSVARTVTPVVLPLGRANEFTSPEPEHIVCHR